MAEEYIEKNCKIWEEGELTVDEIVRLAFLAGLKAGRPQWHKIADGDLPKGDEYGKNSIHRNIYLKDRYGKFFPVKNNCMECYNTVYNTTPLMLFAFKKELENFKKGF